MMLFSTFWSWFAFGAFVTCAIQAERRRRSYIRHMDDTDSKLRDLMGQVREVMLVSQVAKEQLEVAAQDAGITITDEFWETINARIAHIRHMQKLEET